MQRGEGKGPTVRGMRGKEIRAERSMGGSGTRRAADTGVQRAIGSVSEACGDLGAAGCEAGRAARHFKGGPDDLTPARP